MTTRTGNLAKAHRLLAPRIAYLIGTRSLSGEANLIPVSNVTSVSTTPELVAVAVFKEWRTYDNLCNSVGFTISVPKVEQHLGAWRLGARYSRYAFETRAAKLAASGLCIEDRDGLPGPILADGLGWANCQLLKQLDVEGDHGLFLGEITQVAFDSETFDPDGNPFTELHPLMQVTGNRFATSAGSFILGYGDEDE